MACGCALSRSGAGSGMGISGVMVCDRWIWLVDVAFEQIAIGVDAAVAQEWPDATDVFAALQVDLGEQDFRGLDAGFGEDLALRTSDETRAPELDAGIAPRCFFESGAIAAEHRQAI